MSVQQRSRMQAVLPEIGENRGYGHLPLAAWLTRGALAAASLAAVSFIETPTASAVPSYARQTGQPCATCHTAFPELTPYGRQFKLMGYTSGGTRCNDGSAKSDETQVPLAIMAWPANYTSVKSKVALPDQNGEWLPGQFSLFIAGQLYCDVGAFSQSTYNYSAQQYAWDLTDIRYAKTGVIDGTSVVYGITANNNPGVQDVWNSMPTGGFSYPWLTSLVAPTPAAGPMIGTLSGKVASVGGYVWINSSIYAEFTAYGNLSPRLLTDLAGGAAVSSRFAGMAPYWRLAYEKTWDKNSLMFGTFGAYFDQQPTGGTPVPVVSGVVDPTLDVGFDSQYQWIGEEHAVTLRASWIWENKRNNMELNPGWGTPGASNLNDQLNSVNVSASYIYDRTYSFTAGYFNTWGTTDPLLYGSLAQTPGSGSLNGSPNSSGWSVDAAYLPFMHGGPDLWPWFNARLGVLYTHYDKFDGSGTCVDQNCPAGNSGPNLKASGNDSVLIYTWLMF